MTSRTGVPAPTPQPPLPTRPSRVRRSRRFTIRHLTLGFLLSVSAAASCGEGSKGEELDSYLCTHEDVGEEYQELARGNFSPRDLADLGPDADSRVREFEDAGMEPGRFAFFKQALPKPPFDPPIDVLCQVIEFESDAAAQAFVRNMAPEDSLATTAMAWIPDEDREFEEVPEHGQAPDGTQRFIYEVRAGGGGEAMAAKFDVLNFGKLVRTIAVGHSGEVLTEHSRETLRGILSRWAMRVSGLP